MKYFYKLFIKKEKKQLIFLQLFIFSNENCIYQSFLTIVTNKCPENTH